MKNIYQKLLEGSNYIHKQSKRIGIGSYIIMGSELANKIEEAIEEPKRIEKRRKERNKIIDELLKLNSK